MQFERIYAAKTGFLLTASSGLGYKIIQNDTKQGAGIHDYTEHGIWEY
jgi:hypothetical protein